MTHLSHVPFARIAFRLDPGIFQHRQGGFGKHRACLSFLVCSSWLSAVVAAIRHLMEPGMEHDLQLRAAAREIYESCYPSDEWAPFAFDEAERYVTIHYRQAVGAAQRARSVLRAPFGQPVLF
jgi:hypothetical protein